MKKKIIALFIGILCLGCNKDDTPTDNNPYLIIPLVNLNLNLNLPEYNPLKFPGNSLIITSQGVKGIVIYNVNNDLYIALDLSDPNHIPSACSKMILDGIIATCPCTNDANSYNIALFGQHESNQNVYPMQAYRTERLGDNLRVFN